MKTDIRTGDALAVLKNLPPETYDACFCDPPYGLSFMGKAWDHGVPPAELWAEVLRVLKPGAPLMAFGGTRTYHRLACAIEDAGFAISDTLVWLHGQGFPKGHAQLKPAWEPVTLAWKKGPRVLAIDAGRIEGQQWKAHDASGLAKTKFFTDGDAPVIHKEPHSLGRWPANVILDEEARAALDQQSGDRPVSGSARNGRGSEALPCSIFGGPRPQGQLHKDSGGASRFFYCAKASRKERDAGLDQQAAPGNAHKYGSIRQNRGKGYEEGSQAKNTHPTVKPLQLCEYLARLILPSDPHAKLLVPFSGSGSEMLGAKRAGWKHITGIEREAAYVEIAAKRLAA